MSSELENTQLVVGARVKHKRETSEHVNKNNVEWEYPLARVGVYKNDIWHLKVSSEIEACMYIYIANVFGTLSLHMSDWCISDTAGPRYTI